MKQKGTAQPKSNPPVTKQAGLVIFTFTLDLATKIPHFLGNVTPPVAARLLGGHAQNWQVEQEVAQRIANQPTRAARRRAEKEAKKEAKGGAAKEP